MSQTTEPTEEAHVVQFLHPGHEYNCTSLLKHTEMATVGWKLGNTRHDRKYFDWWGDFLDADDRPHEGERIGFWGEWEPPSRVRRINERIVNWGPPAFAHEPLLPSAPPAESHQNTDPLVFGEAFTYSNCQQPAKKVLRHLAPGSMILFGRGTYRAGNVGFRLDTCLVVAQSTPRSIRQSDTRGFDTDLVENVVTNALFSKGGDQDFVFYTGATYTEPLDGMFSFFPAVPANDHPHGFARPMLEPVGALEGLISPRHPQGIKATSVSGREVQGAWLEIVRQVRAQGLVLGTHAKAPEVGSYTGG